MFFKLALKKKQPMVYYSPQSLHLNEKKGRLEMFLSFFFFFSCPNDLSKNLNN